MTDARARSAALPWRRWFQFAVLSLGLTPEDFWALTLDEWRFLAPDEREARRATLDSAGLSRLIALYPDETPRPEEKP